MKKHTMTARLKLSTLLWLVLLSPSSSVATAQTGAPEKGPRLGEAAPLFQSRDQFGRAQTFATLKGPRGLVLLFFRSADW